MNYNYRVTCWGYRTDFRVFLNEICSEEWFFHGGHGTRVDCVKTQYRNLFYAVCTQSLRCTVHTGPLLKEFSEYRTISSKKTVFNTLAVRSTAFIFLVATKLHVVSDSKRRHTVSSLIINREKKVG